MALVDPLRATAGTRPGRELLPGHLARRPRNRVTPLYFPPRFGRALYPAQDPMALQSRPEDAPVPPRRETEGCGRAGRESGPEGRAARGPSRRGQAGGRAPGKATPERPRRPHRCAAGPAGAADSGGPLPTAPAGRTASFPGAAGALLPLPRNCGLTETQFPPAPVWLRLPRHHLAASGSALLSAPGNFPPPAPPSRSRHSPALALPPPSHLRSAGGAERAAIPSAPAAPGVAVGGGVGGAPVGPKREAGVSRVPAAETPQRCCLRVCVRGAAARSRPPPARLPPGLLAPGRAVT